MKIINIVKKPYVFSILTEGCGVVVAFLFTVFQARFLGAEIKGQVATVNSIVSIACILFGLGLQQAYPYFRKKKGDLILTVFLKIAISMILIYTFLAIITITTFSLELKYAAVLLITPIRVYDLIISEITLVEKPNKRNATYMIGSVLELFFVLFLWLTSKPSLMVGVIIITFKNLIKSCIFTFWWRKNIFIKSEPIYKWLPTLVKFGFFPMLSLLMSSLNYRVDVIMLNGWVSDKAIGIYSIGVLLADRMWMIPDALKGIMVSNIVKGKGAEETAYVIRLCNTLCLFIVVAIVLIGNQFITFAFGSEYNGAYSITLILLVGVFPMTNYKVISAYNTIIGKQNVSFWLLTVSVIMNIIMNLILIPRMGIYGAGVSSVVSYIFCSIEFVIYFCRITKISIRDMLLINKQDVKLALKMFQK